MLTETYLYTTRDLLYPGRDFASTDVEVIVEHYSYADALKPYWNDIAKLFADYLVLDNHVVVSSFTDSSEDVDLPSEDTSYDNMNLVDNEDIQRFYTNLILFLFDTASEYAQKLSLYNGLIAERLEKPSSTGNVKVGVSDMPITATFASAPGSDVLSSLTETTTTATSEASTPLDRYEAAIKSARSILKEWYNDYVRRFALYE